jgi:aminopeptidase N
MFFPALIGLLLALHAACTPKSGSNIASTPTPATEPAVWDTMRKPLMGQEDEGEAPAEYAMLNEAEVMPEAAPAPDTLPPYNPSHTFEHDLLHTKIEISFDWPKKRANGKATLTLRPWFYATGVQYEGKPEQLKYSYDNAKLRIQLGKTYTRNEEFKVVVTYTAKPDERAEFGGSAAITSDKGLYFINADGKDKDKPMQIWTQGETESNSFWFPTVDKPNERCTQEMYITVENKFKTLSNGLLLSSKKNADGTRTDYWKMDKPHAPYLFMMAIGEYAVVKDKWRGMDVDYYVEPKYEPFARDIFPYTVEMLDFFSNKLGYPYPWPKLAQVVVRDYVSGAMENTTGIIYGEYVQKNRRELMDDHLTNEKVVAHEMFHHWFGDLVTTESWANLTLNEGFANYSEYLWLEHKYGREEADLHEMNERQGYIFSAAGGGHPLVHFGYDDKENMFDAHSYNKGGAILHMLRNQIGDDAFFSALQRYLKKNEYTDVEAHELRLAFEDVTGQDLNWFFNQWFFAAGHPNLEINYDWDETAKKASVTITQVQEGADVPPIFDLPLAVDIYAADGTRRRENIRLTKRSQTFLFDAPARPAAVDTDADRALLAVKRDNHSPEEWAFLYRNAKQFLTRWEALEALEAEEMPLARQIFQEALSDKFHALREKAVVYEKADLAAMLPALEKIAEKDSEPSTRAAALRRLGETGDAKYVPLLQKSLGAEQPYSVVSAALSALAEIDPQIASQASKALQNDDNEALIPILSELYGENPNRENLPFFEQKLDKVNYMGAFAFFDNYQKFLTGLGDPALLDVGIQRMNAIALSPDNSEWRRFSAAKALFDVRGFFRSKGDSGKVDMVQGLIREIKAKETDPTLKQYYELFDAKP